MKNSDEKEGLTLTRRTLLVTGSAAAGARIVPKTVGSAGGRRILTLVYDKALGMMRAVDRLVP